MEQRRKFSRIGFTAGCSLVADGQSFDTTLINISMKGALVEQPEQWQDPPGHKCDLILKLDEGGMVLKMGMEAVRTVEGQLGLLCVSIDVESATHLRRLLELNFGDPELVGRELVQR